MFHQLVYLAKHRYRAGPVLYRASCFYCNLICELLRVLIINPKGLEEHPLGSTPGHTTIFELALLIDLFYVVRVSIYVVRVSISLKSFVCLFVSSFLHIFGGLFFKCVTKTKHARSYYRH